MYILHLEDDIIKQYHIQRALEDACFSDFKLDHVNNLSDGIKNIERQIKAGRLYDLIITDMWYPERNKEAESASGKQIIKLVKEKGWNIPIIVCSTVDYEIPGILGSVHYDKNKDWEHELVRLVRGVSLHR